MPPAGDGQDKKPSESNTTTSSSSSSTTATTLKSRKREQIEKEKKKRAEEREKATRERQQKEKERKEKEEALKKKQEDEAAEQLRVRTERNDRVLRESNRLLGPTARPVLLAALRKATLTHNDLAQEIIVNHLLRNFLHHNMYQEADLFVANTKDTLSQPFRSNNQLARYFYYLGRIRLVQVAYAEANDYFQQALRKAPDKATGFKTAVTKMAVLVQLLLGEIPPRSTFRQPELRHALQPYLQLTSSVRFGELTHFNKVLQDFGSVFRKDGTYSVIQRIHQNVIKTGLRRIIHAYTKISIADICNKLELDFPEDAEYIVAKAIRDGVIDATIDHESGVVISTEIADVYSTAEPTQAFQRRIQHLVDTHKQVLMAMRYMPSDDQADKEEELERAKRMEEEKAIEKALSDEDDEMDM